MMSINATFIPPELISLNSAAWIVSPPVRTEIIVSKSRERNENRRASNFMVVFLKRSAIGESRCYVRSLRRLPRDLEGANVALWPEAAQIDVRSNVGYQGDKQTRSTHFEFLA